MAMTEPIATLLSKNGMGHIILKEESEEEVISPMEDPSLKEIIKIIQRSNVTDKDRIVLTIDEHSHHPVISVQKKTDNFLTRNLPSVFPAWKTLRSYEAPTHERLLKLIRNNPEYLMFDQVFEYQPSYNATTTPVVQEIAD